MIVRELTRPKSIAVIGGSNDVGKPGGKLLKNLLDNNFKGKIYVVNPKEEEVQGLQCYKEVDELPKVDLAIIAIAAKYTEQTINILADKKNTKGFIILSAGFSEIGEEGRKLEERIVSKIDSVGGSLIGPNCIGVLTDNYTGVFAGPIPKLSPHGVDCVSASGATMVFILESAIPMGIPFAGVYSVGNSAQIGVEEVLEYWDETFDKYKSPRVKLLYMEQIKKPHKLLCHARSLVEKGCSIAAIKAGTSDAGSRAVSSHTGALAGSDTASDALLRKAGIVRCYSREELVYTVAVMLHKTLLGKNLAVVTHAGGPAVMLTDALSNGGMNVPALDSDTAAELKAKLFPGSSVGNPIDFLATGTAEQLEIILDYVDNKFDNIDGAVVIFGTTGMWDVTPVYDVLHKKMQSCQKPIFPVLPSVVQAADAVKHFLSLGRIAFTDEVALGNALTKVYSTPSPFPFPDEIQMRVDDIRAIVERNGNGYLPPEEVQAILDAACISQVGVFIAKSKDEAVSYAKKMNFPLVMKVVGPVHKSDVGGVILNVKSIEDVANNFDELMGIKDAEAVLLQEMLDGVEVFAGVKREDEFGHLLLCGLGGIYIEVFKDVAAAITPVGYKEAKYMISSIKGYDIIKGVRGREGVNEDVFADVIVRLSKLAYVAPEIAEMDINPLIGTQKTVKAVDARILLKKR